MKSGVEREDSLWERKSVLVTILAVSIKKKPLNPVFHRTLSFAMATKKKKPKQLNRFPDGVYRDAKKKNYKRLSEWKVTSKQTKKWKAVRDFQVQGSRVFLCICLKVHTPNDFLF